MGAPGAPHTGGCPGDPGVSPPGASRPGRHVPPPTLLILMSYSQNHAPFPAPRADWPLLPPLLSRPRPLPGLPPRRRRRNRTWRPLQAPPPDRPSPRAPRSADSHWLEALSVRRVGRGRRRPRASRVRCAARCLRRRLRSAPAAPAPAGTGEKPPGTGRDGRGQWEGTPGCLKPRLGRALATARPCPGPLSARGGWRGWAGDAPRGSGGLGGQRRAAGPGRAEEAPGRLCGVGGPGRAGRGAQGGLGVWGTLGKWRDPGDGEGAPGTGGLGGSEEGRGNPRGRSGGRFGGPGGALGVLEPGTGQGGVGMRGSEGPPEGPRGGHSAEWDFGTRLRARR